MEDFSPSRVQPVNTGAGKNTEDALPSGRKKARVPVAKAAPPPVEMENEDEHQLDEQA